MYRTLKNYKIIDFIIAVVETSRKVYSYHRHCLPYQLEILEAPIFNMIYNEICLITSVRLRIFKFWLLRINWYV